MAIKRRDTSVPASSASLGEGPDDLSGEFPLLLEFLSADRYPDGGLRQPGTLVLFLELGWLKACLSDRDQGLTAFCSAPGLRGLLRVIEAGLAEDSLDWRKSGGSGRKKK